ncbi:MAG: hypothetical protein E7496_06230 [Ruminococcus sp.]|nr:hypothetical protein [Ruminococcus sp.]
MKKMRNLLIAVMTISMLAGTSAVSMVSSAADAEAINEETVAAENYSYTIDGDTYSFYDYQHQISIVDGTLKDGKDISFYGLNDDGNLATVYFNVQADEGMAVVVSNDAMVYINYAGGEITETERTVGTVDLFGFDMSLADSTMTGMMKVFSASLGSFVQAYGSTQADYSAISGGGALSGTVEYVRSRAQNLVLMDDNYITNQAGSANTAFMANEWGIYSGYQVVDGVDYSTFCFFGTQGDVYYYGYAKTESGYKVITMKGTVSEVDDRTKTVALKPVDMSRTSDNASQYITKMASCLMAAQGGTSLNLDTLELYMTYQFTNRGIKPVIEASTSTASGTLAYSNGVYTGTIQDENGNAEELSVKADYWTYVVTSKTSGIFTVDRYRNCSSSLADSNPAAQCYDFYYVLPADWFSFWTPCWSWTSYSNCDFSWLSYWFPCWG